MLCSESKRAHALKIEEKTKTLHPLTPRNMVSTLPLSLDNQNVRNVQFKFLVEFPKILRKSQ